jgi:hypothetical protein
MPNHVHNLGITSFCNKYGGGTPGDRGYTLLEGEFEIFYDAQTNGIGENLPHNNMPPFLALRTCIKIKEDVSDLTNYAKIEDLTIYAKKQDLPSTTSFLTISDAATNYPKKTDFDALSSKVSNQGTTINSI